MKYKNEYAFLTLVGDVLNGKQVRPLPEGVSADDVYALGVRQNMVPITFCGLNSIDDPGIKDSLMKYQDTFLSDCTRSEVQMGEYEKLIPYLCAHGVKALPLKGCVIKRLYPIPGLRVMCDIDLLYDGVTPEELSVLMEKAGYSTENLKRGCHELFHRKPCMNIELHRKLVPGNNPYRSILQDMFFRAVPDEGITGLYHMKPEDLYIHVIVHAAKHFENSGLGIRPMGDIYVLNRTYEDIFDRKYINESLASVGLTKFEEKLKTTAHAFFGEDEEKAEVSELDMEFFFSGGTYGKNRTHWQYMGQGRTSRVGFILDRFFLPYSSMKEMYPVLEKAPVLLPFMWMYRGFEVILTRRGHFNSVVGGMKELNKENSEHARKIMDSFGLGI